MTTPPERGIEELAKELRMVANMINMGEKIQWARETTLMDKSADMLEVLHQELQKDRETLLSEVYKELEPFSPDYYDTTPTEDERIANRYTRAMLDKLQTIIDRYQSELDQPIS